MRTTIKILFALILLIIISLAALPFFIDPNDYKDEIATQVEKATGRQLTLEGDIELSVFPWIALELGPMSLSNAKGFQADKFAKVSATEIRIKLLPLLKKQLEMDTIILDGLVLNLEKAKNGRTNWDDLAGTTTDSTDKKTSSQAEASTPALAAVSIAGVQLTNANILWSDASKGESYQLKNFNLKTDPLSPGKPTAIDMNFDINSSKPQIDAHLSLESKVSVDLKNQQYTLSDIRFTTTSQAKDMPFSTADLSLTGQVDADMTTQKIAVSDLLVKLKAELTDPNLPVQQAELSLSSQITTDLKQQTANLSDLVLNVQDLTINADINASQILSDKPQYAGSVHVQPFNLRNLAKELGIELPEMADSNTLELVELQTQLAGGTSAVNADKLIVTLDQSKLTGQLGVTNFAKPALKFKLALDEIDADRYLPPVKETDNKAVATPATAAGAGSSELPLEALRQINAKGTLDIGKLKITGMHSENIHVTVDAADGLVKLSPMSADLYQGQYKGNVTLDARSSALKLAIDEKVINVQAEPLLNDMTGEAQISGLANAGAKLTGVGKNVDEIKQTLSGNGGFSFENGALKGINLGESIRKAKAAIKGQTITESDAPVQTDFAMLSGTFTATNGLIDNQDLALKSPLLRVTGAGQASLPKETINYNVKVAIVGTSKGQGGKELEDLKGLSIPVKITGTFAEPKPTVDLGSLLKDKAKQELQQKAQDKLKDKLGGELGGLLGGALGTSESKTTDTTTTESTADSPESAPAEEPASAEEQIKNKLKSLF